MLDAVPGHASDAYHDAFIWYLAFTLFQVHVAASSMKDHVCADVLFDLKFLVFGG